MVPSVLRAWTALGLHVCMHAWGLAYGLACPVLTRSDAQMGGAEGVDKGEINRLTLQPGNGMWMICKPRVSKRMLVTMPEE